MNTQAPHPAKTKSIPSISKNTLNGDLYCSKAKPRNSIKTNMIAIRIMIAGMILGKSSEQHNTSPHGPYGDHTTVIISIATDASEPRGLFNATD
jgi:hypothetical protein